MNDSIADAVTDDHAPPLVRQWHVLRDFARLYFAALMLGLLCLSWSILALPLFWILPRDTGRIVGRWAIHTGFKAYLWMLEAIGACRFDLSALNELAGQPPMIIAPNHPSQLDAVLIMAQVPRMACVTKASLLDNLFLGSGARLAGYIRNDSLRPMIEDAVADLRRGSSLLLFPEGTRTSRQPVDKINGSIGLVSRLAQVPVQTLLIEVNSGFLGKGWKWSQRPVMPIIYHIRPGKRFAPPQNARQFGAELEDYFAAVLSHEGSGRLD
jgi:1-acyl-sn-glycerol-3-phosphate acyltransferase